jgi:hypothetical protein
VLPDDKVQVIGGDDAGTMEVYSAGSRLFNALVHLPPSASLLPETLRSGTRSALFTTAADQNVALSGAAPDIIELLGRDDHTVTEAPGAGRAVVAGGVDKRGPVLDSIGLFESSGATVTTDDTDYAPGETISIHGAGWQPGETVVMTIREEPETHPEVTTSAVADAHGRFANTDFVPTLLDAGRAFTITAVGLSSGRTAQTAFSDALGFDLEQCQNGSLANSVSPAGPTRRRRPPTGPPATSTTATPSTARAMVCHSA